MDTQDLLTYLFNAIALSFITIATIDFITGLVQLWQASAVSPCEKTDLRFQPVKPEPAPGSLPVPPVLEEILLRVDIDNLRLRPARKIAKALGIAQKVNGKDQPLSWLKAQIQTKLQQPQPISPEAILAVRELLAG